MSEFSVSRKTLLFRLYLLLLYRILTGKSIILQNKKGLSCRMHDSLCIFQKLAATAAVVIVAAAAIVIAAAAEQNENQKNNPAAAIVIVIKTHKSNLLTIKYISETSLFCVAS